MTVTINTSLEHLHPFFSLSLVHAAIGSYPHIGKRTRLAMNRSLWVFQDSAVSPSFLRDCANEREHRIVAGRVYFMPCHHEFSLTLTEETRFVSFQFAIDLLNGVDIFRNYGRCEVLHRPELVTEAQEIIRCKNQVSSLCRLNHLLFGLAATLLTKHPQTAAGIHPQECTTYMPAILCLQASCTARMSVAKMAEACRMRQDVFSRGFTQELKITPKEFITSQLIKRAIYLLMRKDAKTSAVAAELEFSSEYYFYRFFKKHTGLTPGEFKKLNIGEQLNGSPDEQSVKPDAP